MKSCELSVRQAVNGYTMSIAYQDEQNEWRDELYLASTVAKLKKMVNNAINTIVVNKEEIKNAD